MTEFTEFQRRWRIILGAEKPPAGETDTPTQDDPWEDTPLDEHNAARDAALAFLYDRTNGAAPGSRNVTEWLKSLRTIFEPSAVQLLQRDAVHRVGLYSVLSDPDAARALEPNIGLVEQIMLLGSAIPPVALEAARAVVRTVTEELEQRLRSATTQAVRGALNKAATTRRPRLTDVDWNATIRANLRHYQPEYRTVIPERLIGHARSANRLDKDIVLCVDQSGSMASSIVYTSVFAAVLASLPAISTKLVFFDTDVVDLSDTLDDPVDMIFSVRLGGGTDIDGALGYAQTLIRYPSETVVVLISDMMENGVAEPLVARARHLVDSDVAVIGLLALTDDGAPSYDKEVAAGLAAVGVPTFACTPDHFPDLMATALSGGDVHEFAESRGMTCVRPATQGAATDSPAVTG